MRSFVTMIFLLFLLLFFHNDTIHGAQQGLLLWYQTLIPSLLPFILITNAYPKQMLTRLLQNTFKNISKEIYTRLCPFSLVICAGIRLVEKL